MASRRARQATFDFPNGWGGRREGSGRKRMGARPRVPHRTREAIASRFPVHVTVRVREGLPSLRRGGEHRVLSAAFRASCERGGFRLVHYAILSNHIHLVCEAKDRESLSRGIQGLCVRIAKRLNRFWKRVGKVFADRFHDRLLRTPREVRNALAYVLHNARRHGVALRPAEPDPFSSGRWFDGWRDLVAGWTTAAPVATARTWLLSKGWRRHRLIRIIE